MAAFVPCAMAGNSSGDQEISSGFLKLKSRPKGQLEVELGIDSVRVHAGTLSLPQLILEDGGSVAGFVIRSSSIDTGHSCCSGRLVIEGSSEIEGRGTANLLLIFSARSEDQDALIISGSVRLPDGVRPAKLQMTMLKVAGPSGEPPTFWSFQGGSYPERYDWIVPLTPGFARDNFQGMNAPDYGGGIPMVDLWNRSWGVALGILATRPEPVALPVRADDDRHITISLRDDAIRERETDKNTFTFLPSVLIAHRGDFAHALDKYAHLLEEAGVPRPVPVPPSAYDPEWCAWGYDRSFVPGQITATLPVARSLGFGWATVDDGWQTADGDWRPDPMKFPIGLKQLSDSIHAAGLLARLWWVPLEAHDSSYQVANRLARMNEFGMTMQSDLALEHPDWFQMNADGSRTQVSWWNSYTLCPAVAAVRAYYCDLVKRMVGAWGFDGLKIDGQNLNAIPPCYNPLHHHASPYDAPRAVPIFFKELAAAAKSVNPGAVIQVCPCGTAFSIFNLPYITQAVASDPLSAFQVRLKARAFHSLRATGFSYSGDHVELTNRTWNPATAKSVMRGEEDFASTIGVGGVPASKFTIGGTAQPDSTLSLTPEKKKIWKSWISAYQRERPSEGEYLPLYDMAFDVPETHVIRKGESMYFAFFSPKTFSGTVRLRGLESRLYEVHRFLGDGQIGTIDGRAPDLPITFTGSLMLKLVPQSAH
jgi:alpha-galactosidase